MSGGPSRSAGSVTAIGCRKFGLALTTFACVALGQVPASADPLPDRVGACSDTTVMRVGPRLSGDPRSGAGILYENGGTQVSYEVVAALLRSRKGDRVRLCLVSIPTGCPQGDVRGRIYRATNLRTNGSWTAPDSQHTCGGA